MIQMFYSNRLAQSRSAFVFFVVMACGQVAKSHTTENSIPLAYLGFASPFGIVGDTTYTDVWGEGDIAYLGSTKSGVALIDIADPSRTALLDTYLPDASFAFDTIQVHDHVGYWASSDGGGLHIVELQSDNGPQLLATIDASIGASNDINGFALSNDLLYLSAADSDKVFAVDISDRQSPHVVGSIETGELVAIHDLLIDGNTLFAAGQGGRQGDGGTYLYDIADFRANGATETAYFESGEASAFLGKSDNGMLVVTQMRVGGGLEVWDVTDPTAPQFLTRANASDFGVNADSTVEVFVEDQIAYVAWHQEGVQLLDLDNVQSTFSINRIGHYDTSPNTSPLDGYIGNTGVYVYPGHERVLLTDSRWGLYIVDASKALPVEGDFDGNGGLNVADLDQLTSVVIAVSHDQKFDLTGDGFVTREDRERWVLDLFETKYGDSNLDRSFNSSDLIVVFQAAEYEDGILNNSTWTTGDWNGDGEFDSGDIVFAFQNGGYELNALPRPVPEPSLPLWSFLLLCFLHRIPHSNYLQR